ncbi:hypothetical protein [Cohnella sp. JJ-181]|uniref:hypothetical protein n=1 Tax=Cohnella rhizoplanae TaxID=2974897 RepID=UPI0022FFBDAF|nr:hypothetical protein [Cohnella sp. JJ-181]CAI6077027.1 hypothetical protein COHCIP112018_02556 [Cohnella sp. JJ-181]
MKKKVLLLTLIGLLAVAGVVSAAGLWGNYKGYAKVKVMLDGKQILTSGVPAINFQGSTMLPLAALKSAGVPYTVDLKKQTINIGKPTGGGNLLQATKDIIALGGDGVSLTDIEGDITSVVYFPAIYGLDDDWTDIDQIFKKLVPLDAVYMRVVYIDEDEENVIEIKTSDYARFLNGAITDDELQDLWITSGPLFDVAEDAADWEDAG